MLILYGIPNCDSVKKARRWLESENKAYNFHDFRKDGLRLEQLRHFVQHQSWENLLNRRSSTWNQLSDPEKANLCESSALELMLKYPTLIKRPVLDTGTQILIGFSAEHYQQAL